ncbi:MAG: hypothetical protein V5789_14140 [Colwellia sp.]
MKLVFVKVVSFLYLSILCGSLLADEITKKLTEDNTAVTTIDSGNGDSDNGIVKNNSIYPVHFFDQYTPINSMDMINKLPGFSFDAGADERGFGGSAGNVLVNGARPISKSGGLEDALQRIPASQVLHIEILRGGVSAGEAAGQSVVANIVKKDLVTSGTWSVNTMRTPNGVFKPQIAASLAIKLGQWDTSFDTKVGVEPEYRSNQRAEFDSHDSLISRENEIMENTEEYITFNGEGSREFGDGKLTINTTLHTDKWQEDLETDTFTTSFTNNTTPDKVGLLHEKDYTFNAELGLDWVSVVKDWKLHIIALTSADNLRYKNNYHATMINSTDNEYSQYSKDTLATEHIIRTTYGKVGNMHFKPEFGLEIANNRLDTDLVLIENGITQTLGGADVVEELRGEFFVNFVYSTGGKLTFEGGLTAEISNIKSYSDLDDQNQTFTFIKPRLSANYTLNNSSSLTLVAEHEVEQLDFSDFAANSDITDDLTTEGNTNLQPEQVTALSLLYDWRFSARGSINIEAVYEFRKDIHEQIFLPSGNEGLGNAGDADLWFVETNVSLPIDAILPNGLFEIYYLYTGSDFYDPIINNNRTIYDHIPHELTIDFRQDVTQYNFSWGMQYTHSYEKTTFYVDQIRTEDSNKLLSLLFIETTYFFNMKTRLEIQDFNVAHFDQSRYYYQDDRSGAFNGSELIYINREPEINLTFSGTF